VITSKTPRKAIAVHIRTKGAGFFFKKPQWMITAIDGWVATIIAACSAVDIDMPQKTRIGERPIPIIPILKTLRLNLPLNENSSFLRKNMNKNRIRDASKYLMLVIKKGSTVIKTSAATGNCRPQTIVAPATDNKPNKNELINILGLSALTTLNQLLNDNPWARLINV